MTEKTNNVIKIDFPANIEYISALRTMISDIALVNGFSQKYAFRSEAITDEICSNAVNYGSPKLSSVVALECMVYPDMMKLVIRDEGGKEEDINGLQNIVKDLESDEEASKDMYRKKGRGLDIVKMLADGMEVKVEPGNLTEVRVVKMRDSAKETALK